MFLRLSPLRCCRVIVVMFMPRKECRAMLAIAPYAVAAIYAAAAYACCRYAATEFALLRQRLMPRFSLDC